MTTPWIQEQLPASAPPNATTKPYRSDFAFYGLIRNKSEGQFAIVLRQIKMKEGKEQVRPIDFEVVFEHRLRHHPVYLCKLVKNYFEQNIEYRKLTFFWLQMLELKGVLGADKGFFSEEALVIMMVTWLEKNFFLTKAQIGLPEDMAKNILKEVTPQGSHVNLGYAWTLRG